MVLKTNKKKTAFATLNILIIHKEKKQKTKQKKALRCSMHIRSPKALE